MDGNIEMYCTSQTIFWKNCAKGRRLYVVAVFLGIVCSTISTLIIIRLSNGSEYFMCSLLPVGFSIFLILTLFCDYSIYGSAVFWIFVGLYFLKLVVTPAINAMGDWYTLAEETTYIDYLPYAICLTVWEAIFIGFALIPYTKHLRLRINNRHKNSFLKDCSIRFDGADWLIILGVLFVAGTLLYYPPLRVRLQWLLQIETNRDAEPLVRSWRNFSVANSREMPLGIIDTLMMKVFYVVRVLFPVMLMEKIYRTEWEWRKKAFISLLIILTAAQITTESNGETILCAIGLVLLLFALYPRFKKKYSIVIIIVGVFIIVTLFYLKVKGSGGYIQSNMTTMQSISAMMNAYMNGPINLAIALNAKKKYNIFMGIEEVLGGLPFLSRFFQGYQTSIIFNETFWGFKGRTDQLLPSLGQGYMYFGAVYAPILQLLFIMGGLKFEDFARKADNIKVKGYFMFLSLVMIWRIGNNLSHVMTAMVLYLPGIIMLYCKRYKVKI